MNKALDLYIAVTLTIFFILLLIGKFSFYDIISYTLLFVITVLLGYYGYSTD